MVRTVALAHVKLCTTHAPFILSHIDYSRHSRSATSSCQRNLPAAGYRKPRRRWSSPFLPTVSARTLLMIFGAWALVTGVSHILAARRASVEDADRGPMTTMGAVVTVVGLVLLIWPGTGVVTISWIIALAALLVAAFLIFLALRLKRFKKRVDNVASLRSTK